MKDIHITRFCVKDPQPGTRKGTCVVCGAETDTGHKNILSGSFTGYQYFNNGNVGCEYCYPFFKEGKFRRSSWVATSAGVEFMKAVDCYSHIINPPQPPFAIYITRAGKKQGWLAGLYAVNYSRDRFIIMTDFAGCFMATREDALEMDGVIRPLLEKGVNKGVLLSGNPGMHAYAKAMKEGYSELLDAIGGHIKKPLWEVLVNVARRTGTGLS